MIRRFWSNTPKLKTKIITLISLILLVQIIIISLLSLFIFRNHISSNANIELSRELERTHLTLELLKNQLYNRVSLLRYTIEKTRSQELNRFNLYNIVHTHFTTINTERIVVLTEGGSTLFSLQKGSKDVFPLEKYIDLQEFRFIKNKYYLFEESPPQLYLVTGSKIYHPSGRRYYLFFMNVLDSHFANNLFKETGTNFALFGGETLLCSVVPDFELPENVLDTPEKIWISSIPYQILAENISSDIPGGLFLVVLRSTLQDNIYQRRLNTIFLISFLITFIVSIIYAFGVSNSILSPFYNLNSWLSGYLETGESEEFTIKQKDEIGFLTRTAHSMVEKLIAEKRVIREQLKEISYLNKYNSEIVQNLKAGVLVVDDLNEILFSNTYLASILNVTEESLKGLKLTSVLQNHFFHLGDCPHFPHIEMNRENNCLLGLKASEDPELRFLVKIIPLDDSFEHKRTLIVMEDVTATERLWNKILLTEKIASLGMLSAGMAHEVNNPLGSILSHINYLKAVEKDEDKLDSIFWLEAETKRIENIVNRVLTFSQTEGKGAGKADINMIINEVVDIGKYAVRNKDIEIVKRLCKKDTVAIIGKDEFKQVFINLYLNAAQAIRNQGTISISTSRKENEIIITISDSGNGIRSEDLKNIFNPFFSTKRLKDSSGLGLSITYSILQRVGGEIWISSTPKEGTNVEVTIPAYTQEAVVT